MRRALSLITIHCDKCNTSTKQILSYNPQFKPKKPVLCKKCYEKKLQTKPKHCHIKGCKEPPIVSTKIQAQYGNYDETWFYCERHEVFAQLNGYIDKIIPSLVKEAVGFAKEVSKQET